MITDTEARQLFHGLCGMVNYNISGEAYVNFQQVMNFVFAYSDFSVEFGDGTVRLIPRILTSDDDENKEE